MVLATTRWITAIGVVSNFIYYIVWCIFHFVRVMNEDFIVHAYEKKIFWRCERRCHPVVPNA